MTDHVAGESVKDLGLPNFAAKDDQARIIAQAEEAARIEKLVCKREAEEFIDRLIDEDATTVRTWKQLRSEAIQVAYRARGLKGAAS
jgi:hypothetical protein